MLLTNRIYRKFVAMLFFSCLVGSISTYAGSSNSGVLMLQGEVLRYNQYAVWRRIFELAGGNQANIVVISAAHDRAKLYGEFATRALIRYGPFVELLPLSLSTDDFDKDYRQVVGDSKIIEQVREANGVFFVGGSPQRLAKVLLDSDNASTPLADVIREVYASGGLIVGGIPGQFGVNTGIDAMLALKQGRIAQENLYHGLDLIAKNWFVDQHFLSPGRIAETLVAMHQTGKVYGIGIYADSAVIFKSNQLEVMGEEGAVIIDLSNAITLASDVGINLKGIRLSYLVDGDRINLSTMQTTRLAETIVEFYVDPNADDHQPMLSNQSVSINNDLLTQHRLTDFMSLALDSEEKQAIGFVLGEKAERNDNGFKFRFYTGKDTSGWLTTRFSTDKYVIHNIYLDISPVSRTDTTKIVQ